MDVSSGFRRQTTVIHLQGGGEEGVGEDVVYDGEDHDDAAGGGPVSRPRDRRRSTLGDFCARVDALDLFPVAPVRGEVSRLYRRWAFHSAALDLALRQAGRPLHDVLGRMPRPVAFVNSRRLPEAGRPRLARPSWRGCSSATRRCASSSIRRPPGTSS